MQFRALRRRRESIRFQGLRWLAEQCLPQLNLCLPDFLCDLGGFSPRTLRLKAFYQVLAKDTKSIELDQNT